ncbi:MAG: nitroreductase family deazaflavin-dependent oxidoreductase [Acidimicrobiia bacterium]|nr:nitroreductase family deazaflavin-dependent oxidoreductase [Acidimicrobiia bacterium]
MAYPRWLAKVNKKVFNPRAVRSGKWPVVTHWGRSSGRTYRTPADALPTHDGYVLVVRYGPESDWVRNILAAGEAELKLGDDLYQLTDPRLVSQDEAVKTLVRDDQVKKDFYTADHYLLMKSAG